MDNCICGFNNEDEIDPGMRSIIQKFNKAGYETLYSCEGHFTIIDYQSYNADINGDLLTKEQKNTFIIDAPYIVFRQPEDNCLLNFILNYMTLEMMLEISHFADGPGDIAFEGDDNRNTEIDLDVFLKNHNDTDRIITIYIKQYLYIDDENDINRSKNRFERLQNMFLENLNKMGDELIACTEAYNELNVRRTRSERV